MKVYRFKCKDCGSTSYEKVDKHTYKCSYCGYREEVHKEEDEKQPETPAATMTTQEFTQNIKMHPETSRILINFLLCIFFGTIGVHKFMERRIGLGLLYLFTFGLFGIGIFIDIIRYVFQLAHVSKGSQIEIRNETYYAEERGENE